VSLGGTIAINGRALSVWSAQRVTNTGRVTLDPDTVSTYKWEWFDGRESAQGTLDHRYGDGPEALAAAVLTAVRAARS
jgi:hypothetical protein